MDDMKDHFFISETERLEKLLNALPTGIVIIDCNTRKIIDLNPQALAYFDLPLDQLVGKICTDHICPAEKDSCPILDKGQTLDRSEKEIIIGDGSRIPVLKTVIKTELDNTPVLIECIIDIRDKKIAEEEHLKREKLQTMLELAGAVCHEFNQPLQVILGFCELIQRMQNLDDQMKKNIDSIATEIHKMKSLTHDLSNITKYETKDYLHSKIVDIKRSSGNS
ncbi:MAG: PAS domain-containing protein [Proteobacteria bacterium]|nr:PAS domain-containing protein [Pseudomonadota bacterium]MBU1388797.1 PAS domain-containing protein [Pseudomonadota bacterium]MBU1543138.1 PAS domain-containing protein [Pseudomonadota bacterium]MBU2430083.1 PAS domain-containing protein [Pseudomonadota bacterium]MBU2482601.1 PAS domain-containing protein [Pseudomonadota bacterium]